MKKKLRKKKAFTLTELLVVVVIIGVLATVVMPKYMRMLDTRKTTEAEEIMRAIRTEQERRCSLGKEYATNFNQLANLVPEHSNYYAYSLFDEGKGVAAAASEGSLNYTLKMPSVVDGRICCEGTGCDNLNKDYPLCSDFHYVHAGKCSGEVGEGYDPDDPGDPGSGYTGCTGTAPQETKTCQELGAGNLCGTGLLTLRYTCDESSGEWVAGAWEGADSCTPKQTAMITEKNTCPAPSGALFGQHAPKVYKYRLCNVVYDCNGGEESRQCGAWSECPSDSGDAQYQWVETGHHNIGPVNAALIGALIPPLPSPIMPGVNLISPSTAMQLCIAGGSYGSANGSSMPTATCTASTAGSETRTYVFQLSTWWQQLLVGFPSCTLLVTDFACRQV